MEFKDLIVDHDYYASDNNYYDRSAGGQWNTWADFYEEYADADIDMNLIYRWDIKQREKSGRYYMEVFIIHQRKGIYAPHYISYVDEKDFESIKSLLQKHWEKLQSIWNPISTTPDSGV